MNVTLNPGIARDVFGSACYCLGIVGRWPSVRRPGMTVSSSMTSFLSSYWLYLSTVTRRVPQRLLPNGVRDSCAFFLTVNTNKNGVIRMIDLHD